MILRCKIGCKIGLHWPMRLVEYFFTDIVVGKPVYQALCPCGRAWMVGSRYPFFKVPLVKLHLVPR